MTLTKRVFSTLAVAAAVVGGTATQALAGGGQLIDAPAAKGEILTPAEDGHLTGLGPLEDGHLTELRPLEDGHLTGVQPLEDGHITGAG
ncbi:hypothetical protein ACGFX7_17810 [Streptomyces harbinensis]|uniref:hypothetical protein n=1 Tax=Streptomyces harbinensis TaxID=1176198 RepID=UPI0037241A82